MSMTKLTAKEKNQLFQEIWNLRNKMVEQLAMLEKIHDVSFPTHKDGIEALYIVFLLCNSQEYTQLESTLRKLEQE